MMAVGTIEILLVEDNEDDARLAMMALADAHLANSIEHVSDGEQALDFLYCRGAFEGRLNGTPKVVLLDLKLPKIDGLEVLRNLRADPRFHDLPIVILTSSDEESDVARGYKLGANSFITKPVDFDRFGKAIQELGMYWLVLNHPPPI